MKDIGVKVIKFIGIECMHEQQVSPDRYPATVSKNGVKEETPWKWSLAR